MTPQTGHSRSTVKVQAMSKNRICLWYDKDAQAAARFYAATFPDSAVGAVHHAPSDYPDGKEGDELTVEFTVLGIPCLGLNGGPVFKHNEAFSFQIATEDQEETDRYWNAIVGNGGQESQCSASRANLGRKVPFDSVHALTFVLNFNRLAIVAIAHGPSEL